jgi:hypothetical protein
MAIVPFVPTRAMCGPTTPQKGVLPAGTEVVAPERAAGDTPLADGGVATEPPTCMPIVGIYLLQ